jgi:hypothetical protein
MRLLLALLLTGCAATDGWYREFDFHATKFEWVQVQGPNAQERLENLCGGYVPHLMACTFRIKQSGYCLTYSRYSEDAAKQVRTRAGMTLYADEQAHCGIFDGKNIGSAWGHR